MNLCRLDRHPAMPALGRLLLLKTLPSQRQLSGVQRTLGNTFGEVSQRL